MRGARPFDGVCAEPIEVLRIHVQFCRNGTTDHEINTEKPMHYSQNQRIVLWKSCDDLWFRGFGYLEELRFCFRLDHAGEGL